MTVSQQVILEKKQMEAIIDLGFHFSKSCLVTHIYTDVESRKSCRYVWTQKPEGWKYTYSIAKPRHLRIMIPPSK